ncbi:MAG: 4Fe-4S binding protein [Peptococcaceae bacterium]|nr:4Fe-4S binding protein [Peptococcaceae bacterium]
MNKKINAMFFSATDTTKKIVCTIAQEISEHYSGSSNFKIIDFTLPAARETPVTFTEEDLVVFGVPVYAGRVPNLMVKYIASVQGRGALAIPVVLYGNRDYDDALIELRDLLEEGGFKIIAAAAFIGEHAFSKILAKGRPDEKDLALACEFARQVGQKLKGRGDIATIDVKGNRPYRKHYMPKNKKGIPVDIRKVKPKTNDNCIDCKLCARVCPMGSIDFDQVSVVSGVCIKCCACIKKCPTQAKYFDDSDYLWHKEDLEMKLTARKEPELFLE